MNKAEQTVKSVLLELGILSEESKEKVCLITDIVKTHKLAGLPPPDADGFDKLYDSSIHELELIQEVITTETQLGVFTKMFYHR